MHIKIPSERQLNRTLPILLEIETLHVAQCECPDRCVMLRRLREDIAEVRDLLSKRHSRTSNCRKLSLHHKQRNRLGR
jgi:hypothetical protein